MRASVAVAVLLSSSVSQAADDAPRVRAALAVERMEDATLRAGYSVTNVTRDSLRFVYSDAQQYDFVLSDEGRELWRWSADWAFAQVVWEESLAPGASILVEEEFRWPADHAGLLLEAYLAVATRESTDEEVSREETRIGLPLFHGTGGGEHSDFDGSGVVDFPDFRILETAFGTGAGDSGFQAELDLDGDGRIGFGDFFLFASSFGTILPAE